MTIYINNYENLVIIKSPKTICVDLPIKINQNLKHEIEFIVSCNESLAKYTIKDNIIQLLIKYGHEYGHKNKKITKLFVRKFELYIKQCFLVV